MSAFFNFMTNLFAIPFGYILSFLYGFTNSYVISLILITIFVKLCLLPIDIYNKKQNNAKAEMNAKINAIKEKYPDDKERAKEKISQIQNTSKGKLKGLGFFTFSLQLFVLVGLFNVMNTPLTNIVRLENTTIEKMEVIMAEAIEESNDTSNMQILLLEEVANYKDALLENGTLTEEELANVLMLQEKFSLFNINLSLKPQLNEINELWLFPLSFVAVMLVSGIQALLEAWKARGRLTGPLAFLDYIPLGISVLYFFLFFMFPVGIIFYFTVSNLISFIQRIILSKLFTPAQQAKLTPSATTNNPESAPA